jgi:hypothetical protein
MFTTHALAPLGALYNILLNFETEKSCNANAVFLKLGYNYTLCTPQSNFESTNQPPRKIDKTNTT